MFIIFYSHGNITGRFCMHYINTYVLLIAFCVGEIKAKTVVYFYIHILEHVWKIQYSGWQIQHGGQSRGVKNLIKGRITTDHVSKQCDAVLDVS